MATQNNPTRRIHKELAQEIDSLVSKNNIQSIQASKEIADLIKQIKNNNRKIREIKF